MQISIDLDKFDAVVFDFDGTLVDSLGLWHEIDHIYLNRFNLTCPPDLSESINGMSFTETAKYFQKRFNLPRTVEEIKQDWIELAHNYYMNEISFKPGAKDFLTVLEKENLPAAVATSNNKEITEPFFQKRGISLFDFYSYGCDCQNSKPDPEVFLQAAKNLGVNPSNCLAFEDSFEGVSAAKDAGMTVIAVRDKWNDYNKEKIAEIADFVISSYEDIVLE